MLWAELEEDFSNFNDLEHLLNPLTIFDYLRESCSMTMFIEQENGRLRIADQVWKFSFTELTMAFPQWITIVAL